MYQIVTGTRLQSTLQSAPQGHLMGSLGERITQCGFGPCAFQKSCCWICRILQWSITISSYSWMNYNTFIDDFTHEKWIKMVNSIVILCCLISIHFSCFHCFLPVWSSFVRGVTFQSCHPLGHQKYRLWQLWSMGLQTLWAPALKGRQRNLARNRSVRNSSKHEFIRSQEPMTAPWCWYIYTNIKGYIDGIHVTIYSIHGSVMGKIQSASDPRSAVCCFSVDGIDASKVIFSEAVCCRGLPNSFWQPKISCMGWKPPE